jgi:phytoene dehydrogenase-like protein
MAADAVVVGSGPNGLSAAITLAEAGREVIVYEAADEIGGGCRTEALTEPGFLHDVCSAIHPFGVASPVFRSWPLEAHGLSWVHAPVPLAHPLDGGDAVALHGSVDETADGLGPDGTWWRATIGRYAWELDVQLAALLAAQMPPSPFALARLGAASLRSASGLCRDLFDGARARALFAGMAAHANLPLSAPGSAAFGLLLAATGHAVGWPMAKGGSKAITDALASHLRSLGGTLVTGRRIDSLDALSGVRTVLLDVAPGAFARMAGDRIGTREARQMRRYRHGPAAFKMDFALSGPVPWAAKVCGEAGTVHLGGDLAEIAEAERAPWRGRIAERPFVLVAQPSRFDPTRAPEGKHVVWAYCHVPNGWQDDAPAAAIEAQIERFAPGFRDLVIARSVMRPADLERHNANYVGGDINGGALDLKQLLFRPVARPIPWRTGVPGVYLCSASTFPGPGVHGMCGYLAAKAALRAGG